MMHLYLHIGPFFKMYAWMMLVEHFPCVSYPSQTILVSRKVWWSWNQEVTWNDKLYPCWNGSIKKIESWVMNQTFQTCSCDSRWIIQQKSWRVHVELMSRKCFKTLFGALSGYCFDQSERLTSVAVMRFDPKWKL